MGAAARLSAQAQIGKPVTRLPVVEGHRLWAESYDTTPNPLLALEMRVMLGILGSRRIPRIIDVACGTGRWLLHFQQSGASVTGIDICDAMLLRAAQHRSLHGRLMRADVVHLPFCDGAAGLVFCSLALGYFPDLRQSFLELARICAPGGQVAVSDIHPEALAAGWSRSFKAGGANYEIDHCLHRLDEIHDAASAAGLRLVLGRSAYFGDPERPVFQSACKDRLFAAAAVVPAIFVRVWERSC